MYNKVVLVGNLTRDPELSKVGEFSLCKLGLAVNHKYRNRDGELADDVCFVDIEVWGKQADMCVQYLYKGSKVLVDGKPKL